MSEFSGEARQLLVIDPIFPLCGLFLPRDDDRSTAVVR